MANPTDAISRDILWPSFKRAHLEPIWPNLTRKNFRAEFPKNQWRRLLGNDGLFPKNLPMNDAEFKKQYCGFFPIED